MWGDILFPRKYLAPHQIFLPRFSIRWSFFTVVVAKWWFFPSTLTHQHLDFSSNWEPSPFPLLFLCPLIIGVNLYVPSFSPVVYNSLLLQIILVFRLSELAVGLLQAGSCVFVLWQTISFELFLTLWHNQILQAYLMPFCCHISSKSSESFECGMVLETKFWVGCVHRLWEICFWALWADRAEK